MLLGTISEIEQAELKTHLSPYTKKPCIPVTRPELEVTGLCLTSAPELTLTSGTTIMAPPFVPSKVLHTIAFSVPDTKGVLSVLRVFSATGEIGEEIKKPHCMMRAATKLISAYLIPIK